jgi:hypothetical protein
VASEVDGISTAMACGCRCLGALAQQIERAWRGCGKAERSQSQQTAYPRARICHRRHSKIVPSLPTIHMPLGEVTTRSKRKLRPNPRACEERGKSEGSNQNSPIADGLHLPKLYWRAPRVSRGSCLRSCWCESSGAETPTSSQPAVPTYAELAAACKYKLGAGTGRIHFRRLDTSHTTCTTTTPPSPNDDTWEYISI